MGNVELLQLALEAGQLGLPLLVELHLGRGVRASSLKTRGDVLNILLEHGTALLSKCLVSGLREERLLLKDGKEGHRLLKHVNTLLQIHSKVNIGPVETLLDILLLL